MTAQVLRQVQPRQRSCSGQEPERCRLLRDIPRLPRPLAGGCSAPPVTTSPVTAPPVLDAHLQSSLRAGHVPCVARVLL